MVNEAEALLVRQMVRDLGCENAAVAVEGKRDAAALTGLGFGGMLMQFHRYGGLPGSPTRRSDTPGSYSSSTTTGRAAT